MTNLFDPETLQLGKTMACAIAACPHYSIDKTLCVLNPLSIDESPPMPRNRSLVIASLEMGRMLADRGKITFRAHGTCMFPCIQPGDLLHIESRTIDQVQVGDIAVYRRGDCLFGHRTIAKGSKNGRPYIVTRPDRVKQDDDGPTYGEDVLGAVTRIERGDARMPLQPQALHGIAAVRAAGWEWWHGEMQTRWINLISSVQQHAWYRRLASAWLRLVRPRLSYHVRVPLTPSQSHDLYRELQPEAFDVSQASWHGKPITRWLLTLHLNGARTAAVSATIDWHPEDCPRGGGWHVSEMETRLRYHGAGLEEALIHQAKAILARGSMTLKMIAK